MTRPRLFDFISLKDLPSLEEIYGNSGFLKVYKLILKKDKNNARQIMARHVRRKPMSIKKKLKSIIKEFNARCCWSIGKKVYSERPGKIKNIEDLEEKLLSDYLEY